MSNNKQQVLNFWKTEAQGKNRTSGSNHAAAQARNELIATLQKTIALMSTERNKLLADIKWLFKQLPAQGDKPKSLPVPLNGSCAEIERENQRLQILVGNLEARLGEAA